MLRPDCPPGFDVEELLGEGRSAVVWLARHLSTGQCVALKVWRSPLTEPSRRERFLAESRWQARLRGEPHIVEQIWASDVDDPQPWTASRAAGHDVATWLRRRDGSYSERLTIADGVLAGLDALHRRGLVHRDVNPHNVLVDEDGRVRLCDLGLVLEVDRSTQDPAAGTAGFVAPELEDGAAPGFASDVYSAAQVIADLLGSEMTPSVEHIVVTRALSQRPSDRPADAGDFRRGLAAAVATDGAAEDATTPADPPPRSGPPHGPADRIRGGTRLWIGGAAGVLLVASVVAAFGRGPHDLAPPAPSPATAPSAQAAVARPTGPDTSGPRRPPAPPFPGEDAFVVGRSHPQVATLDAALIVLGCTRHHDGDGYQASESFTEYTRRNVRDFQLANPELDGDPDGIPGPRTWDMLFDPGSVGCD